MIRKRRKVWKMKDINKEREKEEIVTKTDIETSRYKIYIAKYAEVQITYA